MNNGNNYNNINNNGNDGLLLTDLIKGKQMDENSQFWGSRYTINVLQRHLLLIPKRGSE